MARGGDPPRIHHRRSRARSASPPPADGGDGPTSRAVRSSAAEVAAASARGCSVPPRRGDGGVSSRQQLESLRVASVMEQPQGKMVHPQLRLLLSRAMARMNKAMVIDGAVLDEFLRQISDALLKADFSSEMVSGLRAKIKTTVDLAASGSKTAIKQAVVKQLCRLIDSGKKPGFVPKKGKPCVVLVIGLKGTGKTTSCAKFAYHHQCKGHSPSLICADTKGEQAFERLKQIAGEANIPCYGSYSESDPVKIAVEGVDKLRKENSDLIIIDACGSHLPEDAFLSEICKATKPDLIVLVVDAGGGRSAFDQAQTFKTKVPIGSVIVTKMDDHSTGGGALNALAAASLPVILLGTGKRIQEYQIFDVKLFTEHLLDHKARSILIDTEDMHRMFDNLKVSETERRSAMDEVEKECCNAYNAVLEKQKLLAQQIYSLESKYKRLCDVLGEKDLKKADIQSATSLKERHTLMLISLKSLEKEKNTRTKKLQVLLSKGLASFSFLGVTNTEQKKYTYMLENLTSSVQEANSLSTKFLEKLEIRVRELEAKKAEHYDQSRQDILRQGQIYIRGGTRDRDGLKDLIKTAVAWEAKHSEVLLYEKKGLLMQLKKIEDGPSLLNFDTSRNGDVNKSDTEMGQSTSSSGTSRSDTEMGQSSTSSGTSRSDTEMGQSSTSSGTSRSDWNDPDYSPESTESDIEMGHLVVSESSDST